MLNTTKKPYIYLYILGIPTVEMNDGGRAALKRQRVSYEENSN